MSVVHRMCCTNFAKADEDWLVPLLTAIAEAAPLACARRRCGLYEQGAR